MMQRELNMDYTILEVGKEFELFRNTPQSATDGAHMECLEDGGGLMLIMNYGGITKEEEEVFAHGRMNTKLLFIGNKAIFSIHFEGSELIQEVVFDPTLYGDYRAMEWLSQNNLIPFVFVDRGSNIIKVLRYANMPERLRVLLLTCWQSAHEEKAYSENYQYWVSEIYNKFTTEMLYEVSLPIGYFGEEGDE
jgi:hypothetical protein